MDLKDYIKYISENYYVDIVEGEVVLVSCDVSDSNDSV